MSDWIASKPLDQFTWNDIEAIINQRVSEGPTIEFKGALSAKGGNKDGTPQPWMNFNERAWEFARDEIFEELSAFANSYGGILFLGIAEDRGTARPVASCAAPMLDAARLEKRFADAMRSSFDPPLPSFQVVAVEMPEGSNGEGVVVFRVPQSTIAPHGFGNPVRAYIRRDSSSMQMNMRDLQSVFWESRTQAERIMQKRARFEADFETFKAPIIKGSQPACAVRISIIPQQHYRVQNLTAWSQPRAAVLLQPGQHEFGFPYDSVIRDRHTDKYWYPKAQGIRGLPQDGSHFWDINEDGSINVIGTLFVGQNDGAWLTDVTGMLAPTCQAIFQADILRRFAGHPGSPMEIDARIDAIHGLSHRDVFANFTERFTQVHARSDIGPFLIESRVAIQDVFAEIERQAFAAMARTVSKPSKADFPKVLGHYEEKLVAFLRGKTASSPA